MAERFQVYKCDSCGNTVEMLCGSNQQIACCGKPMRRLLENVVDASIEKHVPVIKESGKEIEVKVGSVPHPMDKDHYIEWIEAVKDGKIVFRQYLNPGEAPEARFKTDAKSVIVRDFCNLHGLWKV